MGNSEQSRFDNIGQKMKNILEYNNNAENIISLNVLTVITLIINRRRAFQFKSREPFPTQPLF